jgi:sorbose reductase
VLEEMVFAMNVLHTLIRMRSASALSARIRQWQTVRTFVCTARRRNASGDVTVTDRFNMKGKSVLVTGGGRGIGFAICKAVAQLGGNIAILDHLPEPVNEFNSLKSKYGVKASYTRADVTKQDSLEQGFKAAVAAIGPFHGCVTAAGIAVDKPFTTQTWDEAAQVLAVNVMGTFWTAKLMTEHVREHGQGASIVMIASIAAQGNKIPEQNLAIYNMSKAAVKGVVGPLAVELAESGIRVNSVSPGVILSPMTDALKTEYPHLLAMFENAAPLKRIGVPEDLTPVITYLLSDASSFTTGADHLVSGGLHAGMSPSWVKHD